MYTSIETKQEIWSQVVSDPHEELAARVPAALLPWLKPSTQHAHAASQARPTSGDAGAIREGNLVLALQDRKARRRALALVRSVDNKPVH
jgi:hypothetical protein